MSASKTNPAPNPSSEKVPLRVTSTDQATEIYVIDANFKRILSGCGSLEAELSPGIYKLKTRTGMKAEEEDLVVMPGDNPVERNIKAQPFVSSAPLAETYKTHEFHIENARLESRNVHVRAGRGSSIFVFVREWTAKVLPPDAPAGSNPAKGLSLRDLNGKLIADFLQSSKTGLGADPWAACNVMVDPGVYRLRLERPNDILEQTVVACPGWQTQYFALLSQDCDSSLPKCPDLAKSAILMAREGVGFLPDDPGQRLSELGRLGLSNRRLVLSNTQRHELLHGKFQDPMLGIYGAHLLLLRPDDQLQDSLREIVRNLRALLTTPHPDVESIALKIKDTPSNYVFSAPPMLSRSWSLILEASLERPGLIPAGSLTAKATNQLLGEEPWLISWECRQLATEADCNPATIKEAVKSYLNEITLPRHIERQASPASMPRALTAMAAPARAEGKKPAGWWTKKLDREQIKHLVHTLRVPRGRVEAILSELTAQKAAPQTINSELEQRLALTTARYKDRTQARIENERRADAGLFTDTPARTAARLVRLSDRLITAQQVGGAAAELANLRFERVLKDNDLISVSFLEGGFKAARTVARIKVKSAAGTTLGYGTGFMVSPRILLTNHHVLPTIAAASPSSAEFDYRETAAGLSAVPREFQLRPDWFFCASDKLDCALVAVEPKSTDGTDLATAYGWNRLIAEEGKVRVGEMLNIIQHPGGEPQQVALRANQLKDVLEEFLHYQTDTAPGSSGSPVFNDQWEIVALHHSGVPSRDLDGHILADDGSLWKSSMGEHRIGWISNEGVRISRVLAWLKSQATTPAADSFIAEVLNPPQPESENIAEKTPAPAPPPRPAVRPAVPSHLQADLTAALARLQAAESLPYYDLQKDQIDRNNFYAGISWNHSPDANFTILSKLLGERHHTKASYKPLVEVYPWVDLHPDRKLRSIYSGRVFEAEEFIRMDLEVEAARQARLPELLARQHLTPESPGLPLDALEAELPYNCEHVVPQSWFSKREPMRGDLHHLFACESGCNTFRGNIPFYDFPPTDEVVLSECGRREPGRFEPESGKGAVARATLYFLLRYPALIGDSTSEFPKDRLEILLRWHHEYPVTDYELHRNQAIFARQGNRNPIIDFPDRVNQIEFTKGFAGT